MEDSEIIEEFETMVRYWQEDINRHRKKIAEAEKELAKCRRILVLLKEKE